MDLTRIVEFLGGTAIVVAALVYLAKKVFEHALSLNTERFRSALQVAASERETESRKRFAIGATSHMATVAFDKHVQFSERYYAEAQQLLRTLFMEGPSAKAITHANNLTKIRVECSLWLGAEMTTKLVAFESAVRRMGWDARLVDRYPNLDFRQECIDRMFRTCEQVLGEKEWAGEKLTDEIAVSTIVGTLKRVLGIEELTQLRSELVQRALRDLEKPGGPQPSARRCDAHKIHHSRVEILTSARHVE